MRTTPDGIYFGENATTGRTFPIMFGRVLSRDSLPNTAPPLPMHQVSAGHIVAAVDTDGTRWDAHWQPYPVLPDELEPYQCLAEEVKS
jgi:hypothetical protein